MAEAGATGSRETIRVGAPPSDGDLEEALRALISADLSLQNRTTSRYGSTHRIERISAHIGDEPLELVCKYGSGYFDSLTGHRRGPEYEASIYDYLFPDPELSTPRVYGTFQADDPARCLVLEFTAGHRVSSSPNPRDLIGACRDLALFHARGRRGLPQGHNVFDRAHFTRIAGYRAMPNEIIGALQGAASQLEESMQMVIDILSETPRTIIHGELYPSDVIVNDSGPVVIDWESAGVGPGVIDLAVLTQGSWGRDLVTECEETYWRHTGLADPEAAKRSLRAARVFAAVQLLIHLGRKETDGTQEAIAVEEIGKQLRLLTG